MAGSATSDATMRGTSVVGTSSLPRSSLISEEEEEEEMVPSQEALLTPTALVPRVGGWSRSQDPWIKVSRDKKEPPTTPDKPRGGGGFPVQSIGALAFRIVCVVWTLDSGRTCGSVEGMKEKKKKKETRDLRP